MSRIAKKPIEIPAKTTVAVADGVVTVTGPLGTLSRTLVSDDVMIVVDGNVVNVTQKDPAISNPLLGTAASHIKNMIAGVNKPFEEKLVIEGIGYKAEVKGTEVVLSLGFSHLVHMPIPEGVKVVIDKTGIAISGINKEVVTSFAARIRALKKPEPYKGKGIMYAGEKIRRKQGKKAT